MTRLAVALTVFAAGATAVVLHHDRPVPSPSAVAAPGAQPRPVDKTRVSRWLRRHRLHTARVQILRSHLVVQQAPHDWEAVAQCGNPHAVDPTGTYFGLYQFDVQTWASVGGTGNPADASPGEQTYRATLLYRERGSQPWPVCGRYL